MILHLIDKVAGLVDEVILAVNYGKEHLEQYFNEHDCGVSVALNPETEPLGTGGAIKNAEKLINDTFIVFNGDVITSLDMQWFLDFHNKRKGIGVLALWPVENPTRFGIISIDGENKITRFLEKPKPEEIFSNLINAGTYCLEPEVLDLIPGGRKVSIEREVFPNILEKNLYGLEFSGYWFDAGTPEIFMETHRKMLDYYLGRGELEERIGSGTKIAETAKIDNKVLIGKNCKINSGAVLGPYVFLGDGVMIDTGCQIIDSIIDGGTKIGSNVKGTNLILGRDNQVEPNLELPTGLITRDSDRVDQKYLNSI
jgi:mannose-1-phosphate guanylyltransferase